MGDQARPAVAVPPVVKLPREIDATNSAGVMADIAGVCVAGVTTVIADMTLTTFCDSSAVLALVRAHKVAQSRGADLKVAVTCDAVLRVFELTGLSAVLRLYPSVDAAMAA
jgi:anti-sigma B factor antagonist